jgi:hypothetical protein
MLSRPLKDALSRLRFGDHLARFEVAMWSIEERVKVDHVARHVIGPFEDLGRM